VTDVRRFFTEHSAFFRRSDARARLQYVGRQDARARRRLLAQVSWFGCRVPRGGNGRDAYGLSVTVRDEGRPTERRGERPRREWAELATPASGSTVGSAPRASGDGRATGVFLHDFGGHA
jgi:hypothetical protein